MRPHPNATNTMDRREQLRQKCLCPFCGKAGVRKDLRQCIDCGTQLNWPSDDCRKVWTDDYYKWDGQQWQHRTQTREHENKMLAGK
jgi:hypothetical protein